MRAIEYEPDPVPGKDDVTNQVVSDLQARARMGKKKYGTRLQTFNGRDALWDAYQEVLDLAVYIRQELMERESGEEQSG